MTEIEQLILSLAAKIAAIAAAGQRRGLWTLEELERYEALAITEMDQRLAASEEARKESE